MLQQQSIVNIYIDTKVYSFLNFYLLNIQNNSCLHLINKTLSSYLSPFIEYQILGLPLPQRSIAQRACQNGNQLC